MCKFLPCCISPTDEMPDVARVGSSARLRPSPATFFGSGQVQQIAARVLATDPERWVQAAKAVWSPKLLLPTAPRCTAMSQRYGAPFASCLRLAMRGPTAVLQHAEQQHTTPHRITRFALPPPKSPPPLHTHTDTHTFFFRSIFVNHALSGVQQRNLERELGRPVLDRVALIIGIFSQRARTREASLG